MGSFDLIVTFVHKNLRLEDDLQIYPVDQVKMAFKGVRIYKKKVHLCYQPNNANHDNTKGQLSPVPNASPGVTWCPLLSWVRKVVVPRP